MDGPRRGLGSQADGGSVPLIGIAVALYGRFADIEVPERNTGGGPGEALAR